MFRRNSTTSAPVSTLPNSSVLAAAEVAESWHSPSATGWYEEAKRALALPTTARGFGLFLLVLMLVVAATLMQVLLSAQILSAEMRVAELQATLDRIDQQNAEVAYEIAMVSQMDSIVGRARAAGFEPISEPIYVKRQAEALDASTAMGPQLFYAQLPQSTSQSPETSHGRWLARAEGTLLQTMKVLRELTLHQ
jgi:cell division protein FtsL